MHLIGFIVRIYHIAWSPERQIQSLWVVAVMCGIDLVNFKKKISVNLNSNMLIVKRSCMDISGCIL